MRHEEAIVLPGRCKGDEHVLLLGDGENKVEVKCNCDRGKHPYAIGIHPVGRFSVLVVEILEHRTVA